METLRTPDERFENLPGYPFAPHYAEVAGLRVHFVDEGPRDAAPVLMLHGEPTWSYLYRKLVPPIAAAGHRAIAPDLVGFGRSDKLPRREDYTYQRHVDWMRELLFEALALRDITLVCQDWGGLIGLRLVAEHPERFARVVVANTLLPTGDQPGGPAFEAWKKYSQEVPELLCSRIVGGTVASKLSEGELAAYDAPYPDESYKAGARAFPLLVPVTPDDPAAEPNRAAWKALRRFEKPVQIAFSDGDPITGPLRQSFEQIPGAKGQPEVVIAGGSHFLQEDRGEELARVVIDFIARTG